MDLLSSVLIYCNFPVTVDFLPFLISPKVLMINAMVFLLKSDWPFCSPQCQTVVHHMVNKSGFDLIRGFPPCVFFPSCFSLSSVSVWSVGSHCSRTETSPVNFCAKALILIVKLCDRCLLMWCVSVYSLMINFRVWNETCAKCRDVCLSLSRVGSVVGSGVTCCCVCYCWFSQTLKCTSLSFLSPFSSC